MKTYIVYIIFTLLLEFAGRVVFKLWYYPSFTIPQEIFHVFLISYAFAFFFLYEFFTLIKTKIHSTPLAFALTTLINAFAHEIPNTFARYWIYTIPYIKFEILHINIVVIVGWSILVAIPLITEKILSINSSLKQK